MSYESNAYYNPEKFDLKIIASVEWDDEPYQFDTSIILQRDNGYYLARDSGCSCPSPFEDHIFPDDYEGPMSADEVIVELQAGLDYIKSLDYRDSTYAESEIFDAINKLKNGHN